jgi:hypothetical protein
MKFLNNRKGTLTFLLIALLVVSFFWIVKSEIRASSLQSRLDEHHEQLKKNSDEMDNLNSFMRRVGNNLLYIDKNMLQLGTGKSSLFFKGDDFNVNMRSGKLGFELSESKKIAQLKNGNAEVLLDQDNIEIKSKDFGFYIDPATNDLKIVNKNKINFLLDANRNILTLSNEKLAFLSDDLTSDTRNNINFNVVGDKIKFGYNKAEDRIYMIHNGSKLFVGKLQIEGGKEDFGAALISKSGEQIQVREDGILAAVPTQEGTYHIKLASKKKFVEIVKGNSIIRMEGEDISIEALGDINITSKNGKVNINGKR